MKLAQKEIKLCRGLGLNEHVKRFTSLFEMAKECIDLIRKFNRLPFRNTALGRKSTHEEEIYLYRQKN